MKAQKSAVLTAVLGTILFTALLVTKSIGQPSYISLMLLTAFVSLAVFHSARLQELRLTLTSIKLVLREIERVKAEIEQMYGGIDILKREPMTMDKTKIEELGLKSGSLALGDAVMRYTTGVVKRERERLAQIFITGQSPEKIAAALVDNSKDALVFKWNGPETTLDIPPKPWSDVTKVDPKLS